MTATELFDPAFMRSLEGLRMMARRVPLGGRMAEQRSRARGAGVEFTDVRPYVPGDDFRAIDWHLFQRLDRIFLRLFLEEEDLPIHFLLDESASMGQPPFGRGEPADKTRTARQVVAALAYVGAHHLDRVTVHPFAGEPLRPSRATSGRAAFHQLLAWLADRGPVSGTTGLARTVRDFAHRRLRRGLCAVVSDFLDPAGAEAIAAALRMVPHRVLLVRVVHPDEERPELGGELELVDCESGDRLAVHADEGLLDRYRTAYREFEETLVGVSRARQGGYLAVHTDQPVVPQVATLFREGVLEA